MMLVMAEWMMVTIVMGLSMLLMAIHLPVQLPGNYPQHSNFTIITITNAVVNVIGY